MALRITTYLAATCFALACFVWIASLIQAVSIRISYSRLRVYRWGYFYEPVKSQRYGFSSLPNEGPLFTTPILFYLDRNLKDYYYLPNANTINGPYIRIPHWLLTGLAGLAFWVLWSKRQRFPKGHCQGCGYNLTLNETGVYPECNTPVM